MDKSNKNINDDMEKVLGSFYQNQEDDKLKARWKEILSKEHNIEKSSPKPANKYWVPIGLLSIAAILALLLLALNPNSVEKENSPTPKLLYAQIQVITNPAFDHRGSEDKEITFSSNAYYLLKENQYIEVIKIYTSTENISQLSPYDRYHLGLAYGKTDDYENSIFTLEKLKLEIETKTYGQETKTYEEETNWLLALNYLQIGHYEKANTLLNYIIANDHYKSKEAKKLMSKNIE